MKILIFEGIATSGKSTLINTLLKSLPPLMNVRVLTERFTHIPIIEKSKEPCNEFFTKLISEATAGNHDALLFDRLYLTQAFRASCSIDKYLDVEMLLMLNPVITVFLKIDEAEISRRLTSAMKYRDSSWGKYVGTKGQTLEDQAQYYINQQRSQLLRLQQSRLPYEIYDTSNQDYQGIIQDLTKVILLDP